MSRPVNVALVHDWLVGMHDEEQCLEALCEVFPSAPLFTLFHKSGSISETISRMDIRTSALQQLPWITTHYQYYTPLFPTIIEQFDFSDYDLVISSSHCVAKGVLTQPRTCHICYCHTPMQSIWGVYSSEAKRQLNPVSRVLTPIIAHYFRVWDVVSAHRVDHFIASSQHVAAHIRKYYRREAVIIGQSADRAVFKARIQQHIQRIITEFQTRQENEKGHRLQASQHASVLSSAIKIG